VRCLRVHDFVVGGWISAGNSQPSALLLGEFIDGDLRYVGRVGSSADARVIRAVARELAPRAVPPFKDAVREPDARFYEPSVRVDVEFLDFTDDGYLRSPAFRRFADELVTEL